MLTNEALINNLKKAKNIAELPDSAVVTYNGGLLVGPSPAALYASTVIMYWVYGSRFMRMAESSSA